MLNKDQLVQLAQQKNATVHTVEVKDFGSVGLRVMTGTEREKYETTAVVNGKFVIEDFRARLLCKTLCDDQGNRLFSDDEIGTVSSFPSPVLIQLFSEAQKLNALSPEAVDELAGK